MAKRRIVLLIERQVGYRYAVLQGIFRYTRDIHHWVCHGADFNQSSVDALNALQPDGVICAAWDLEVARRLLAKRDLKVVDIFDWHPSLGIPRVGLDNRNIGRLAAQFFDDKGYRNVAFLGHSSLRFSVERKHGFEEFAAEAGMTVSVAPEDCSEGDVWATNDLVGNAASIQRWVDSLPKPVAVFCASDGWGVRLTDACQNLGIDVPCDVSVLGVDNDEMLCQLSTPPLSSIRTSADRVGFAAAQMLDQLIEGKIPTSFDVFVKPTDVIERQSTNVLQINDADLRMALQYISENSHRQLTVDDIVDRVVIPRRTLQRRFKQVIGRSLHEEITRCRLEKAKRMLVDTDLGIPQIARKCGFVSRERLSRTFRDTFDQTPISYRKLHQRIY